MRYTCSETQYSLFKTEYLKISFDIQFCCLLYIIQLPATYVSDFYYIFLFFVHCVTFDVRATLISWYMMKEKLNSKIGTVCLLAIFSLKYQKYPVL